MLRLRAVPGGQPANRPRRRSLAPASGSSGRGTSTSCIFAAHPTLTDRDYLLAVFDGLTKHAGDEGRLRRAQPDPRPAELAERRRGRDLDRVLPEDRPEHGRARPRLHRPGWDTRFLGDLYQDLSEEARKKYALLQTPVFVEEFILDRTLDPAIEEFGLAKWDMKRGSYPTAGCIPTTLQDDRPGLRQRALPARQLRPAARRWRKKEPGAKVSVLVQRALDSVHGVDVNPYAIAIARFRLLLAAHEGVRDHAAERCPGFRDSPGLR